MYLNNACNLAVPHLRPAERLRSWPLLFPLWAYTEKTVAENYS